MSRLPRDPRETTLFCIGGVLHGTTFSGMWHGCGSRFHVIAPANLEALKLYAPADEPIDYTIHIHDYYLDHVSVLAPGFRMELEYLRFSRLLKEDADIQALGLIMSNLMIWAREGSKP